MDSISGFIETKVELVKLDVEEQVQKIIAKSVIIFCVVICLALALFFISIGLASFLNSIIENQYLGYLIISILYILIGLIVYWNRESIYVTVLKTLREKTKSDAEE